MAEPIRSVPPPLPLRFRPARTQYELVAPFVGLEDELFAHDGARLERDARAFVQRAMGTMLRRAA